MFIRVQNDRYHLWRKTPAGWQNLRYPDPDPCRGRISGRPGNNRPGCKRIQYPPYQDHLRAAFPSCRRAGAGYRKRAEGTWGSRVCIHHARRAVCPVLPGNFVCKNGTQDSISLAREISDEYAGREFPGKIKIGVSGCPRCCGESRVRDIGIMGTAKGWTVFFGGHSGFNVHQGVQVAAGLTSEEAGILSGHFLPITRPMHSQKSGPPGSWSGWGTAG